MDEDLNQIVKDGLEAIQELESKEFRQRFRVERVAFIIMVAFISGVLFGAKTDLGTFGLMGMVGIMLASTFFAVNFLLGIGGGFSEDVPYYEDIPAFDWKRFAREPLFLLFVIAAGLVLGGIYWAFNRGN